MKRLSLLLLIFIIVQICSASICGIGDLLQQNKSKIIGKWVLVDQSQTCFPIRGFKGIEFFDDQTIIYYDVFGGKESRSGITADYSLPGDNRIKINVRTGLLAGTDLLDYEFSGTTLRLCDGNRCCDLVPDSSRSSVSLQSTNTPISEITRVTPSPAFTPPTPTPDIQVTSLPTEEPSHQETKDPTPQFEDQIIGAWQSRQSGGGLYEYHFLENGSLELRLLDGKDQILALCKGDYILNGSELTMEFIERQGPEQFCKTGTKLVFGVEVQRNLLFFIDQSSNKHMTIRSNVYQEAKEPSQQPEKDIIGAWRLVLFGGNMEYRFFEGGSLELRVLDSRGQPEDILTGNYTLNGSELTYEITEVPEENSLLTEKETVRVELWGDVLFLLDHSLGELVRNGKLELIRVSDN